MLEPVEQLAHDVGKQWPTIARARSDAAAKLKELGRLLSEHGTPDAAIVVYGSLARREWTTKSDLDWTLLIDGPAKLDQMTTVREIRGALHTAGIKPPSPGGAFGWMSFSHELVHRIGGEADTNRITTQRVLLLLESVAVPTSNGSGEGVHSRVVRSVLDSYLEQHEDGSGKTVPRFLLNDVVRYWRTIAVDFAAKARERGDGWAIRRLKLQTSRKLIFSAGLVMALERCVQTESTNREALMDSLVTATTKTPLDIIAGVGIKIPSMRSFARDVIDQYERFLCVLDDSTRRDALERLPREGAENDPIWQEAREIGRDFSQALERFFFDDAYRDAIRIYGVF